MYSEKLFYHERLLCIQLNIELCFALVGHRSLFLRGIVKFISLVNYVGFSKRVPYTFSVTREWAFLVCMKRESGFIFFVIREFIFFRPRETGFPFFRDP